MAPFNSPPGTTFSRLPSFNAARRYWPTLVSFGVFFALAGLVLPGAFAPVEAASWLAAAGFLSAGMMSYARMCFVRAEDAGNKAPEEKAESLSVVAEDDPSLSNGAVPSLVARLTGNLKARIPDARSLAGWPQSLAVILCGAIGAFEVVQWWRDTPEVDDTLTLKLMGGALLVAAFPLLVMQRSYAGISTEILPEAPALERLLRLPLAACACLGIAMIAMAGGFAWAVQIENVVAVVMFCAAVEVILRGVATLFVPWLPIERRRALADSALAGFMLRLKPPSLSALNTSVRKQWGINLSRSWALAFIQRGVLPLLTGIVLVSWLFSGVTALGINQRGVYERFGVPADTFGPGLHFHLPWPFGTLRIVETGVVHELPIEFVLPDRNGQAPAEEEKQERVAAEAPAPSEADRLWDDAHPYEGSYLIASEENNRQSFQLVNVDMAVIYQTGRTDEAARNAAYRIVDAEALIQALSGQILVRYLSQHQLLELLGESRESLSADFQTKLQAELDKFAAGVEILTISIEAIHPPPGAASAYHDVQAAEIRAGTHVAESRGNAARSQEQAQQSAVGVRNEATAAAAERVNQASTASVLFGGDRQAYAKDGEAFLLERWFDDLTKAFKNGEFLIIDHRLKGQESPTLDMRSLSAAPYDPNMQRE